MPVYPNILTAARLAAAVGLVCLVLALSTPRAAAQTALPHVDIVLVLQIQDVGGWLNMRGEILGTPDDSLKTLGVSVSAGSGVRRSITVVEPKFGTQMVLTQPGPLTVVVRGRIASNEALRSLQLFEHAVMDVQMGMVQNDVSLAYGLASVSGALAELHLTRP